MEHLSFFHPGLQKSMIGFINIAKNNDLFFIPTDAEGQMYLMGDEMRPAVYQGAPNGEYIIFLNGNNSTLEAMQISTGDTIDLGYKDRNNAGGPRGDIFIFP